MVESLVPDDPPVMQGNDSIAVAGRFSVMRDHEESAVVFLLELVKQAEDFSARCRIKIARWFIAQKQGRPENDGSRDRHTLPLATGEFIGTVIRSVLESYPLQHRDCAMFCVSFRQAL